MMEFNPSIFDKAINAFSILVQNYGMRVFSKEFEQRYWKISMANDKDIGLEIMQEDQSRGLVINICLLSERGEFPEILEDLGCEDRPRRISFDTILSMHNLRHFNLHEDEEAVVIDGPIYTNYLDKYVGEVLLGNVEAFNRLADHQNKLRVIREEMYKDLF